MAKCSNRTEARKLETQLITKYLSTHNLLNVSLEDGRFTIQGQHSAAAINSKAVYVYDYQGNYIATYSSIRECSEKLGIYVSTIEKCLHGIYKYAKGKQFSFKAYDKYTDLSNYSTGSSRQVKVTDGTTEMVFKSVKACKEYFQLDFKSTGLKYLLGALNKKFGNKYKVYVDGK